jgi:hydroxyacylglutathione hydrolase
MRLTIDEVARAREENCVLVDIRKSTSFGAAFIHGSLNIGLTPNSADWLAMVVEPDKELVLISDYEAEVAAAKEQFGEKGFDKIRGFLDGGVAAWANAGKDLDHLPQLTVHSLKHVLQKYPDHVVLDVRTPAEIEAQAAIAGSRTIPIGRLVKEGVPSDLPSSSHVTTVCRSGYRSNIAGSFLKANGFQHVYSVLGGMTAWGTAA